MKYPQRPQALPVPMPMPLPGPGARPGPGPAAAAPTMEEYYAALHELQAIDFVLVELTLYLDTHPEDAVALEQFNRTSEQREQLKRDFEARFGPLTQFTSQAGLPFTWALQPWPWEV